MVSSTLLLPLLALARVTYAFNYTIAVGKDQFTGLPGVGFAPSRTVTSNTSDLLVFQFQQGPHRVVQTTFDSPCAGSGGFDTQLVNVTTGAVGPSFSFPVSNSSQIYWFYDAAGVNCQQGAVFCVNTDETASSSRTCGQFKAAALQLGVQQGIPTSVRTASAFSTTSSSATSVPTSNSTITSSGTATAATGNVSPTARANSGTLLKGGSALSVFVGVVALVL